MSLEDPTPVFGTKGSDASTDLLGSDADNELEALVDYLNFNVDQLGGLTEPTGGAGLSGPMEEYNVLDVGAPNYLGTDYLVKFEDGVAPSTERSKNSVLVTTEVGMATEDDDDDDGSIDMDSSGCPSKRRRRVRNAKQQELNRLAQQRYRQRKKQRYCDLQSTVDGLTAQLKALSTVEKENAVLRSNGAQLQAKVAAQASKISQLESKLSEKEQQLKAQEGMEVRLKQQEELINKQQAQIQAQAKQLEQLQSQSSITDTNALFEKVSAAIRAALGEAKEHSIADKVLQHICRSCREISPIQPQPSTTDGHTAIQVSCC